MIQLQRLNFESNGLVLWGQFPFLTADSHTIHTLIKSGIYWIMGHVTIQPLQEYKEHKGFPIHGMASVR